MGQQMTGNLQVAVAQFAQHPVLQGITQFQIRPHFKRLVPNHIGTAQQFQADHIAGITDNGFQQHLFATAGRYRRL